MEIKEKVLYVMESIGVFVEDDVKDTNFDMRDYIVDSLQFISFIVNLEKELGIVYPDELLLMDKIGSFDGFCSIIESLMLEE